MGNVTPSVNLDIPASMKLNYVRNLINSFFHLHTISNLSFKINFKFSIQMGYTDRLRLVLAPDDVVEAEAAHGTVTRHYREH